MVGAVQGGASSISTGVIERAVSALQAFIAKSEQSKPTESLIDEDHFINLVINLFDAPDKSKLKPIQLSIPHSLYSGDNVEICLLVKDPQSDFKAVLADKPVHNIKKVIGFTKLRKNYSQYKDKRELVGSFDLFLADDRILPLLPSVLGKAFFSRKKQPVPVRLSGKSFNEALEKARDSTYMFQSKGSCLNVKIGRSSMTNDKIVLNVVQGIDGAVAHINNSWSNVQSIHLKTSESVALPIYQALPRDPHQ